MIKDLVFAKYQGTGNDFVIIDNRNQEVSSLLNENIIKSVCDRRFGIGADGLILLNPSHDFDFSMRYFNSDGRESTMCGNGGRCLVAFAKDKGIDKDLYRFEAIDGSHEAFLEGNNVHLLMSAPRDLRQVTQDQYWIDTGSPHHVQFFEADLDKIDVYQLGKNIRYNVAYDSIGGTNVNFVQIMDNEEISIRTYERGVENETYSCGTGAAACAYIFQWLHPELKGKIRIHTRGGSLTVDIHNFGTPQEKVYLCGPAQYVFQGAYPVNEKISV